MIRYLLSSVVPIKGYFSDRNTKDLGISVLLFVAHLSSRFHYSEKGKMVSTDDIEKRYTQFGADTQSWPW